MIILIPFFVITMYAIWAIHDIATQYMALQRDRVANGQALGERTLKTIEQVAIIYLGILRG